MAATGRLLKFIASRRKSATTRKAADAG